MPRHKRYAGDSGQRVPMIVHVPEKWKEFWTSNYEAGGRSDWPVGFVDLAPTVLKIAGAEIPKRMQGKSFLGADAKKADYVFGVRNRMDERYDVSRSVCDGKFVYIRNFMPHLPHGQFTEYQQTTNATAVWFKKFNDGELSDVQSAFWKPRSGEELYDLNADPYETVNLAMDPAHQEKLAELRGAVKAKMVAIGDLDLVPESTLFEYEQETGKSRMTYTENEGFDIETVFDAACGKNISDNLKSKLPELRFWAVVNLIQKSEAVSGEQCQQIVSMLEDDSKAVQVKAAEFCLRRQLETKLAAMLLTAYANKATSNYYVACNAVDCLDRYSEFVSEANMLMLKQAPTEFKEIPRGNDNMGKLMRRFIKK